MKEFFKSFFQSKTKVVILIIVLAIAGYFIYKHYSASATPVSYATAQASNQTIVVSVSGTGQVSEDRDVNLSPQTSGKLTEVDVTQGQQVKAGQTIAVVDETNNTLALNQAKAGLASAQASYDQTLAGSTSQAVQLAQLAVQSDQQALDNASTSLATVIKQQDQAVANAFSNMMNSGLQAVPAPGNTGSGTLTISGTYNGTSQGTYTVTVYNTGNGLEYVVTGLENDSGIVNKTSPLPLGNDGLYIQFAGTLGIGDSWTIAIPNLLASSYSSNQNAYQSALTTQQSDITNAQQQITSAQTKLQQDEINLQTTQEPPTDQAVESAKAQLIQAQTSLENAQITYQNNIITAPFDGIVAQLNNQTGDEVTGSTVIATMITNQSVAIIPLNEVDVANVKLGDKATMTFDAVPNLTITGTVVEVDNIGTVSQGVVSYNVKIAFDTEDPSVKSGMSVSASIITATEPDVLSVPNAAVQSQGNSSYVEVLDPSQIVTVPGQVTVTSKTPPKNTVVQIGASNDTYTQILSGINLGDTVVTQTITTTATKSAAASATSALRIGGGGGFGGGGGAARAAIP